MTRQALLSQIVLESRALTARYFAGFDDSNRTKQVVNVPNHFAWTLGHLAYTMQSAAKRIDGGAVPESDFVTGGTPKGGGDARRFAVESVSMGSVPVDDPSQYPTHARCLEIFSAACERCAAAFAAAGEADLEKDIPWGAAPIKGWQLAPRMVWHNGDHAGQLADLRRALGFKSIFS
ncbi:MAG: DinB family protein [Planctomycetes bacterium]|nr:DinB family protein [Planctomycetota bacterium]